MLKQKSNWNDWAWQFMYPRDGLDFVNEVDYQIEKVDLDLDANENIIWKKNAMLSICWMTQESFSCQLSIPKQVMEIKFYVDVTMDDNSEQQRLLCTVT